MIKKTFKLFVSLFALSGVIASCSEDELMPGGEHGREVIVATIAESEGQTQTRTCIDVDNPGNGYLGILWQQNDSIGVYGNISTRNALFKSLTPGNAAQADFGGIMSAGDKPYRAYYPYSAANAGADINALKGTLPAVQPYNPETGRLTADYKYGAPVSNSNKFNFRHLFSLLRVSINATSTPLETERLESIELTVTDANGTERPINGDFTFSAVDGAWGNATNTTGAVRMPWTTRPVLTSGATYLGFITVMPTVKQGDKISITVVSEGHKASFTATCQVDFQAEHVYNIPLTLNEYAKNPEEYGYEVVELPVIKSFGFSVAKNAGKILNNRLVWDTSKKAPRFDDVTALEATVEGDEINLMIPYLYDFKLVPEFTTNAGVTVTVEGVEQKSGETQVDFSKPVTYTVTAGSESRDYTVNVTNTGLPVVVIKQSATGDFSEKKVPEGSSPIASKVTSNMFVDFWVRGKDTEWVEDDKLTVYNADGTVNVNEAMCGVKLRGNTTQIYPKKPFAIKLKKKQPVLGMPEHKRWVLLANWLDHSMIRNAVAFDVAHAIENAWKTDDSIEPGIPWNVHGQNVELVIASNEGVSHHVGNYYLCEQIKIDGNRLNIKDAYEDVLDDGKVDPIFENCGYLLELDNNYDENYKFRTGDDIPFMFKDDVLTTEIVDAVKAKIQGIEDKIIAKEFSEAYKDLDINTVIDQLLIWELTMNHEFTDPRSVYYFMDGNDKLKAGPVWDFDRATFQNVERAQAMGNSGDRLKPYNKWICLSTTKDWSWAGYYVGGSIWYQKLIKDSTFQETMQKRWEVIHPYLLGVVNNIRQLGTGLTHSYEVNNAMWPTTKEVIQAYKSSFTDWSGDEEIAAYSDVIENFVTVYESRLSGMHSLITSDKFTNE